MHNFFRLISDAIQNILIKEILQNALINIIRINAIKEIIISFKATIKDVRAYIIDIAQNDRIISSEDLFIRKAKTTINPNSIKDNLTQDNKQQEEQIINNNPFQNYKNDLPQNKTKHKRQRTHVQLNEIQNEEDASKTPTIILTSNSTSTVVDSSKNTDAFGDTLEDLSNFTKTMRRNNDSKKNVFDDIDPPKDGVISPTSSQLLSSNKKQLFYRTPRDKEKKKIEFTN